MISPTRIVNKHQTQWCANSQVRLSRDVEGEAPYLSALAAFRSRTAYANSGGDHLVSPLPASPRVLG